MSDLELAQTKFNNADRVLRWLVGFFLIFSSLIFIFVSFELFQVQATIAKNQKVNSAASVERFQKYADRSNQQQAETQKYIKCVALNLTKPIAEQTEADFDKCASAAQ